MNNLKDLDKELDEFGDEEKKTTSDIEKLVKLWKENKKVNGVKDSEVESRI